jgi:RNA polymerase sigma factor (TIGR02999 family)
MSDDPKSKTGAPRSNRQPRKRGRPGEGDLGNDLLPLVYEELRRLAAARLARLPPGQTIQPTALVHEAYLRLAGSTDPGWNGRAHFFGAAAMAMHDILVERARRRAARKRGGGLLREDADAIEIPRPKGLPVEDTLSLSEALGRLDAAHPERAEVARLKAFAGMTDEEIARMRGVSVRTIERHWRFACAWLEKDLRG